MELEQPCRPTSNQDWTFRKPVILDLYASKPLKVVMKIMEEQYLFKATENQYKKRISAWDTNSKRINEEVYLYVIGKIKERERAGKDSAFRLGAIDIEDSKIARFQKRKNIGDDDELPDAPSPPGLLCLTPPAISLSSSHSSMMLNPTLSSFDWFSTFGDFINRSAAGTPIIQTDSTSGLLRSFATVVDNYETDHRYTMMIRSLTVFHDCDCVTYRASVVLEHVQDMLSQDQNKAQGLLETAINEYLLEIEARRPSLSLPTKKDSVFFIVRVCYLYAHMGRVNDAIGVLEALASLIESRMKMSSEIEGPIEDVGGYTYPCEFYELDSSYRRCLIAQATCFGMGGYYDEAVALMNRSLGLDQHSDCIHLLASLKNRCTDCLRSGLRNIVCDSFIPEADNEDLQIWESATRLAKALLSRRVSIDHESQPCDCQIEYDPVLAEEVE